MKNLKVIQFQGLAPSVFCGMYFADQGAEVVFVARKDPVPVSLPFHKNVLNRNKKCISIDLKAKDHFQLIVKLISEADILIDPYRPGVLQKLKLGPKQLYQINKRIILLRVSGYGQTGQLSLRPGHDLNYLAVSGIIELINKSGQYQFPSNFMADFVSASLGITGTLAALHERDRTGEGKVIDCSLANGCTYLAQNMLKQTKDQKQCIVRELKLDGKHIIYNTRDDRVLSQSQVLKLLNNSSYYRSTDGDIEISIIKQIDPFPGKDILNPFSRVELSNRIRTKGEDDNEYFNRFLGKL